MLGERAVKNLFIAGSEKNVGKCVAAGFIDVAKAAEANTTFPEELRQKMKVHVEFLTEHFS